MKRYLTFKDEKSDKFWSIETSGTAFTVTYGKTGTDGQSSRKEFDSEEKCLKEAEKLIGEKLKKGYGEATAEKQADGEAATSSGYLKEWEEIVKAKDLSKALIKHFSYLADSPGYDRVLAAVMKEATKAEIKDDSLNLTIGGHKMEATAPGKKSDYKGWPASFLRVIEHHDYIYFGNDNEVTLGRFEDYFEDTFDEGDEVYELFKGKAEHARSPMRDRLSNKTNWLYHPKVKNKVGEEALFPSAHESEDEIEPDELPLGSIFLRLMAEVLGVEIKIAHKSGNSGFNLKQVSDAEVRIEGGFRAVSIPDTKLALIMNFKSGEKQIQVVDLESNRKISSTRLDNGIYGDHRLLLLGNLGCIYYSDSLNNIPCYWFKIDEDYQINLYPFPDAPVDVLACAISDQKILYQTKSSLLELNTTTGEHKTYPQLPGWVLYADNEMVFFKTLDDCAVYDWNWKKIHSIKHKEIGRSRGYTNLAYSPESRLIILLSGATNGCLIQIVSLNGKKPVIEKLPQKFYGYSINSHLQNHTWFSADDYTKKGDKTKLIIRIDSSQSPALLNKFALANDSEVKLIQEVGNTLYVLSEDGRLTRFLIES